MLFARTCEGGVSKVNLPVLENTWFSKSHFVNVFFIPLTKLTKTAAMIDIDSKFATKNARYDVKFMILNLRQKVRTS